MNHYLKEDVWIETNCEYTIRKPEQTWTFYPGTGIKSFEPLVDIWFYILLVREINIVREGSVTDTSLGDWSKSLIPVCE